MVNLREGPPGDQASPGPRPPARKRARGTAFFAWLCLLLVIALTIGFVYEGINDASDRRRLPQIGRSYDIGGRTLNLFCTGTGSPTVIIETGAGEPGISWSHIQPQIARFTRACWYDRAGTGWSEPGPYPRSSKGIASDLHTLLERAGIEPPYVLAGHSFGGLNAREFAGLYPNDVAGVVLIESADIGEPQLGPKEYQGRRAPRMFWHPLDVLFRAGARFGVIRVFTLDAPAPANSRVRTREQTVAALQSLPVAIAAESCEGIVSPLSYAQADSVKTLGNRPLIVLTRGAPLPDDPRMAAWEKTWRNELQANLTKLSTRGRQIIVEGSGHDIPNEKPQAVVAAIREVVLAARGDAGTR